MLNIVPVRVSLANQDVAALLAELEEAVAVNELAGCGCGCDDATSVSGTGVSGSGFGGVEGCPDAEATASVSEIDGVTSVSISFNDEACNCNATNAQLDAAAREAISNAFGSQGLTAAQIDAAVEAAISDARSCNVS